MQLAQSPSARIANWLVWAAFLSPLALLAKTVAAVVQGYSAMTVGDQWDEVRVWRDPGVTLGYLWSQHNEHRIFFGRLIYLADFHVFGGLDIFSLAMTAALAVLGAALFVRLARPWRAPPVTLLALAVALGGLVSLAQWHNFAWGYQVPFVGVFAVGAWAIWLLVGATGADGPAGIRRGYFVGGLALLVVATFSMANGLFAGAAVVVVGLLARRPWRPLAVVGALTAGLTVAYLLGYHAVAQHSPATYSIRHPGAFILYVAGYVGSLWSAQSFERAADVGCVGLVLSAAMLVNLLRGRARDPARLALVAIVIFVLISADLTAFGRLSFGTDQALASRYVTPGCYFWAAQAIYWALTLEECPNEVGLWAMVASSVVALGWLFQVQGIGFINLNGFRQQNRLGESAMLSADNDQAALTFVYYDTAILPELGAYLRQHRKSMFYDDPATYPVGAPAPAPLDPANQCRGALGAVGPEASGVGWQASGWSWDPVHGRPYERVLIVDAAGKVRGVGLPRDYRPDIHAAHKDVSNYAGWFASLDGSAAPPLTAWALRSDGPPCQLGAAYVTPLPSAASH